MSVKQDIIDRFKIIYLFVFLFAFAVVGRIIYLQIVEGKKLRQRGENITRQEYSIKGLRGDILSANGKLLAGTIPMYQIYMDTRAQGLTDKIFNANIDSLSLRLSKFFQDKSSSQYKKELIQARNNHRRYYRINKKKINYIELQNIKTFPIFRLGKNQGGFLPKTYNERIFPFGKLAARTIGYTTRDLSDIGYGKVGLEGAYETELRGESGLNILQKIGGEWIPMTEIEPSKGYDLVTTIDVDLQDITETALEQQLWKHNADHGTVVLMETETGDIKAIANLKYKKGEGYIEAYNYAIGEAVEPGSTFKLPTLMVAMEDGYINLNSKIDTENGSAKYYNHIIRDNKAGGYGEITIEEAFQYSSNVAMTKVINQYYKGKEQQFVDRLYSMNLNEKLNIEILGEGHPYIKYPGDKLWSGLSLLMMSFGYEIQLTPLQLLTFYNAIAHNGKMVKPRFVKRIEKDGQTIKTFKTEIINPATCSQSTVNKAQKLLEKVVESGTATNLKNPYYKIAGKTGTTQIAYQKMGYSKEGKKNYSSSFVGYFPAENPMYSCIVVISSPRNNVIYGNTVAAPVFKKVADGVYTKTIKMHKQSPTHLDIPNLPISKNGHTTDLTTIFHALQIPTKTQEAKSDWIITTRADYNIDYQNKTVRPNTMPNVKGMSLKDALYILENLGLKVKFKGKGMVIAQSIPSGEKISKNKQVTLNLQML